MVAGIDRNQQEALRPETYGRLKQTAKGRAAIAVLDVVEPRL